MNVKTCCCVLAAVAVSGFAGAATDYASLVQEIADAPSGGTVTMAAGSYDATETIVIDKPLTLVGADRATTIVDGKGAVRCFQIKSNDVKLRNLTIQNGAVTGDGAGIYAYAGGGYTGILVSNCLVRACTSTEGNGGGIAFRCGDTFGEWKLIDVDFANCTAQTSSSTAECCGGAFYGVNAEFTRCTFTNNQVLADKARGGAAYLRNHVSLTDCDFVGNEVVGSVEPISGAVFTCDTARAGGITNCLFLGNHANGSKGQGGALFFWSASATQPFDLVGCLFVSNSCGRSYSAAYTSGNSLRINRCLFEGNYDTGENTLGGQKHIGPLFVPNGTRVTECAFVGNRNIQPDSNKYSILGAGIIMNGTAGRTQLNRCVFTDNRCNYLGAAILNHLNGCGFDAVDCWFERNRSAMNPICFVEYSTCTSTYRNCMFQRNEGSSQVGFGHLQNCSFFCNVSTNGLAAIYQNKGALSLTNCVVYGTTYNGNLGYDFKQSGWSYAAGDVSHSYFTTLGSMPDIAEGDQYGNRVGAEIKFVDAANGDFRVTRTDKVLHNGGVDLAWMKEKGACDLGTGPVLTYDDPVRRTGLHITYANAVRRLRGKAADIGCLEYNDKQGVVMMVK